MSSTCYKCLQEAQCGDDWLCDECRWSKRLMREGGPADNPYWKAVADHAKPSKWPFGSDSLEIGHLGYDPEKGTFDFGNFDRGPRREEYVGKYAWTVTDSTSVLFVADYSDKKIIDPMAGTAYWGYLLGQLGVDVVSTDLNPAGSHWHSGEKHYMDVKKMDGADAAALYPDRTLFLSWPPYDTDLGARILNAYNGQRVIFVGESRGGCTGDDNLFDTLEEKWQQVAAHRPVQWWGVHDYIGIYERDSSEQKDLHRPT